MVVFLLALLFGLMSLFAFVAFHSDKRRAERGAWRWSETSLLALAFLGGWPGAKLAQRRFRHKTRKEPFRSILNLTLAGPLLMIALAGVASVNPRTDDALFRLIDAVMAGVGASVISLVGGSGMEQSPQQPVTVTIRRGLDVSTVTVGN
jgi:uncharacterized membrane protein YsdA (DUF1294 family)